MIFFWTRILRLNSQLLGRLQQKTLDLMGQFRGHFGNFKPNIMLSAFSTRLLFVEQSVVSYYLKKVGVYTDQNIVNITIKMRTIVQDMYTE